MKKITFLILAGMFSVLTSFSQVLPDNWTGDTGIDTYQESTNVHGGSYSCRVDVNTGTQGNCDMRHDEVAVTAGDSYTYSFWVWTSAHVKARVVLEWTGASIYYGGYSNAGTGGFEEVVATGTVPTGATGVKVGVRFYDQSGFSAPETQYIDDFTLESPTGTPITLANGDMESWPSGTPPVISNISASPQFPTSSETVSVSADVTDDGSVSTVELNWGTTSGSLTNSINMSNSSGDTYVTDSDIPAQSDGTTIYYEIVATDNDANTTTSDEQQYLTHDAKTATIPYSEDFSSGFGDMFPANVAGKNIWSASSGYAFMNGYNGDNPEEDWLILPGINMDSYSDEVMNFDTYWQYGNDDADNYLKLMYSTDYTGEGDPTSATWTEITTWTKPGSSSSWTSSGDVDISGISGTSVHFAFKYHSTTSPRAWRVDNVSIYESAVDDPGNFNASTVSTTQIDLSWTLNGNSDDVMVVYNTSSITASPSNGTSYAIGYIFADGSEVIYNGGGTAYSHTGLTANTQYYYEAWSVDGSDNYSNGVTDNATTFPDNSDLLISEVADPAGTGNHKYRFVELYNLGTSTIDFSSDTWYLSKQTNGGTWYDIQLTGSIPAGGIFVLATNTTDFNTEYGFNPDQANTNISGNGDDGYFLYYGGDHTTGTLIDVYGVIDEDGTGKDWEYEDTKAVRLRSVTGPNTTWTASEWDIPGSAYPDDMTPAAYREDVTWQGTTDSDWNTKGNNWSGTYGYIPDASFNVTVSQAANNPVISAQSACNDLTLQSDASLTIPVNKALTAYGDLDVASSKSRGAATFTIQSDATSNGSFIGKGMLLGNATVERYFAAWTASDDGWHEIGSPVDMMDIAPSDFAPGTNDDLYEWIEQTETWHNYKSSGSFTQFYSGQGYLVAYSSSGTKHFIGELTNWDYDFTNLPYTPSKGNGWNFLGNPYTSAIEWDAASTDWALSNIGGVAQIWNESTGNYSLINNGDVIPSTNGFFVQATDATNYINIPAEKRVHDTHGNYKSSQAEALDETLVLKITNDENTFGDLTRIGFRADATEAWDITFDAHKLKGSKTAPQFWTVSNNEKFAQNYLPYVYEPYQLPLHFKAGVNTTYHIVAEGVESFYGASEISLEDLFTGKIINLKDQQIYTFTATTDDDENRFVLHFNGITSVGETPADQNATVYAYDNRVYIHFNETPKSGYEVEVFNTLGQQVYAGRMEPNTLNSFRLNEKTGIYIVRVKTNDGLMVQKVMIK